MEHVCRCRIIMPPRRCRGRAPHPQCWPPLAHLQQGSTAALRQPDNLVDTEYFMDKCVASSSVLKRLTGFGYSRLKCSTDKAAR